MNQRGIRDGPGLFDHVCPGLKDQQAVGPIVGDFSGYDGCTIRVEGEEEGGESLASIGAGEHGKEGIRWSGKTASLPLEGIPKHFKSVRERGKQIKGVRDPDRKSVV